MIMRQYSILEKNILIKGRLKNAEIIENKIKINVVSSTKKGVYPFEIGYTPYCL